MRRDFPLVSPTSRQNAESFRPGDDPKALRPVLDEERQIPGRVPRRVPPTRRTRRVPAAVPQAVAANELPEGDERAARRSHVEWMTGVRRQRRPNDLQCLASSMRRRSSGPSRIALGPAAVSACAPRQPFKALGRGVPRRRSRPGPCSRRSPSATQAPPGPPRMARERFLEQISPFQTFLPRTPRGGAAPLRGPGEPGVTVRVSRPVLRCVEVTSDHRR